MKSSPREVAEDSGQGRPLSDTMRVLGRTTGPNGQGVALVLCEMQVVEALGLGITERVNNRGLKKINYNWDTE